MEGISEPECVCFYDPDVSISTHYYPSVENEEAPILEYTEDTDVDEIELIYWAIYWSLTFF